MTDVLAAEWLKIRTARYTRYVLGVLAAFTALMPLLAWYFVTTWDSLTPASRAHAALGPLPEFLGWIASLCMAVFGALAITSEYSSDMIRTTFSAMPRRRTVFAAKGAIVAAVTFVATGAALAATLVCGAIIVGGRPIADQTPLSPSGFAIVAATALAVTAFALIGLGLGAITRSPVASVVGLALLWYLVPLLSMHLPAPWAAWVSSLVPGALAGQLAGAGNAHSVFAAVLSPWEALLVMLAYVAIPLTVGAIVISRRDA
jgi:ABC-2 type transport system permease protein